MSVLNNQLSLEKVSESDHVNSFDWSDRLNSAAVVVPSHQLCSGLPPSIPESKCSRSFDLWQWDSDREKAVPTEEGQISALLRWALASNFELYKNRSRNENGNRDGNGSSEPCRSPQGRHLVVGVRRRNCPPVLASCFVRPLSGVRVTSLFLLQRLCHLFP